MLIRSGSTTTTTKRKVHCHLTSPSVFYFLLIIYLSWRVPAPPPSPAPPPGRHPKTPQKTNPRNFLGPILTPPPLTPNLPIPVHLSVRVRREEENVFFFGIPIHPEWWRPGGSGRRVSCHFYSAPSPPRPPNPPNKKKSDLIFGS